LWLLSYGVAFAELNGRDDSPASTDRGGGFRHDPSRLDPRHLIEITIMRLTIDATVAVFFFTLALLAACSRPGSALDLIDAARQRCEGSSVDPSERYLSCLEHQILTLPCSDLDCAVKKGELYEQVQRTRTQMLKNRLMQQRFGG
jgi:hypothetical protein